MIYRQSLNSTEEMANWYNAKYKEMGGCWYTPDQELDRHRTRDALASTGRAVEFSFGGQTHDPIFEDRSNG